MKSALYDRCAKLFERLDREKHVEYHVGGGAGFTHRASQDDTWVMKWQQFPLVNVESDFFELNLGGDRVATVYCDPEANGLDELVMNATEAEVEAFLARFNA